VLYQLSYASANRLDACFYNRLRRRSTRVFDRLPARL